MLALIASSVAFGLLAGFIAWQANLATYNAYHTIVDEGSVSVDAALRARSAALDHMSAAATFLETTGATQQEAQALATSRWADFNNEARISWRNLSDPTHGENTVFSAADLAASDYIQQIGAMFSYYAAGQTPQAGQAFLDARQIMNTRLVPALGGLEADKVEAMETTYAGVSQQITNWRYALIGVALLLVVIFLAGWLAIRRMHYRWSWPVGGALLVSAALALLMQFQLGQASSDAGVLVREGYDSVAGVQDMVALLSQGRALESIAIFDSKDAATHLSDFDQYNATVEQTLCGPVNCSQQAFLSGNDTIAPNVRDAALAEQTRLGLPHPPLVANVNFPGQVTSGQLQAASTTSTGESAPAFAKAVQSANAAGQVARNKYDNIWQGVYFTTGLNQALALLFPLLGLLAAWGIWQRRTELFA